MENSWVQKIRKIANKQAHSIVDAKIINHEMMLRRRNGQQVSAGPIKVKPPGSLITPAYDYYGVDSIDPGEPDIYVSKDGAIWHPAASEGKFQGGTLNRPNSACWTGDRFMVPIYSYDGFSSVIQSRDGGTWSFHRDKKMFNNATNGNIWGMAALGTGIVLAVGINLGEDETASIAISRDFGETWGLVNDDPSVFPFDGVLLYGVTIKSEYEWVVSDSSGTVWYTRDGGLRWSEVDYPDDFQLENFYASGIRYFRGHWWFFGRGDGTTEWDTCLIKSEDLFTWIPVVTPFSGTYPPLEIYYGGGSHDGWSGYIENMEYDESTNSVICNGSSPTTNSGFIMSTDGGDTWFEIGFGPDLEDEAALDAAGWDIVYSMPTVEFEDVVSTGWYVNTGGGLAYGYGWWFYANFLYPDAINPMMIRFSPDGRISEVVNISEVNVRSSSIVIAGGDMNF